jgi:hypothetical protein
VEGLEDDADAAAAEPGKPVLIESRQVRAVDDDAARIRPLETRHGHQKRRFARPGRPDEADRLAPPNLK